MILQPKCKKKKKEKKNILKSLIMMDKYNL